MTPHFLVFWCILLLLGCCVLAYLTGDTAALAAGGLALILALATYLIIDNPEDPS